MSTKTIITYIQSRQQFHQLLDKNPGIIVVKLGASWCRPCKTIKPVVDAFFASSPDNVICCDIDVDESYDVYSYFKSKKWLMGFQHYYVIKEATLALFQMIRLLVLIRKGYTSFLNDVDYIYMRQHN